MAVLNQTVDFALSHYAQQTARAFNADVFAYVGGIRPEYLTNFRQNIETLASQENRSPNLAFVLYTGGGVAEVVEKMVEIIRYHYEEVWFIVPDIAMSAGTILCMSGDKIYMDYSSALGPIDPQVPNKEGHLVPALGYLDYVEMMIDKSNRDELSNAEFVMLQNQDLATLRRYEQAKDLSVSLLKDWLVKYKFKDWNQHKNGSVVTDAEKTQRAQQIAEKLSNHRHWHSHGRMIGIKTLTNELKLRIEDYSEQIDLKVAIRHYSDLLLDCMKTRNLSYIFHWTNLDMPVQDEQVPEDGL